jgi:hypothetical protein
MSTADKPFRTWQEIAEEASREQDPKRLAELSEEMERAFTERDEGHRVGMPATPDLIPHTAEPGPLKREPNASTPRASS